MKKVLVFLAILRRARSNVKTVIFLKYLLRAIISPRITCFYLNQLKELKRPAILIKNRPMLIAKIYKPYICKSFTMRQRSEYIIQHYQALEKLQPLSLRNVFLSKKNNIIATIVGKYGSDIHISCGQYKYAKEGESTLKYSFNNITLTMISFSFIFYEERPVIFVGGLQGASSKDNIHDATKEGFGMFPKRVLFEILCHLAVLCGISRIYAVDEHTHTYNHWRYSIRKRNVFLASYREFWESLEGVRDANGFYYFEPVIKRKSLDGIISKKRSEYRKRFSMMDSILNQITDLTR